MGGDRGRGDPTHCLHSPTPRLRPACRQRTQTPATAAATAAKPLGGRRGSSRVNQGPKRGCTCGDGPSPLNVKAFPIWRMSNSLRGEIAFLFPRESAPKSRRLNGWLPFSPFSILSKTRHVSHIASHLDTRHNRKHIFLTGTRELLATRGRTGDTCSQLLGVIEVAWHGL